MMTISKIVTKCQ